MKRIDCEQKSPEWIIARLGIPTASRFDEIVTPRTLKPSASQDKYIATLVAEWALGRQMDEDASAFMDRGTGMEEDAIHWLELTHDIEIDRVGFITLDDGSAGASPDGFILSDGGCEIKCPAAHTHTQYFLDPLNDKYKMQIQGGLWVSEREYWLRVSYHPTLPKVVTRFERDEVAIKALAAEMRNFADKLGEAKERILKTGYVPIIPSLTAESGTPKINLDGVTDNHGLTT